MGRNMALRLINSARLIVFDINFIPHSTIKLFYDTRIQIEWIL